MDLEHTNLGKHCEVSDCKQRDFLPFTCDVCHLNLCLAHRTYTAHSCIGSNTKDMTSIDCPMCGLSVKFPKSQDVDQVWTEHYLSNCTQKMKTKVTVNCYEKSCQILLGPSNDFTCSKCKQHVCLSHRVPEDHHCLGMRGAILSKLPPQTSTASSSQSKPTHSKTAQSKPIGTKTSNTAPIANPVVDLTFGHDSIYKNGTAQGKRAPAPTGHKPDFDCPFCSQKFPNSDYLQTHVNRAHSEFSYSDNPPPSTIRDIPTVPQSTNRSSDPNLNNPHAREVCPQCQMRFVDAIELVNHFESAHPPRDLPPKKNADCILG